MSKLRTPRDRPEPRHRYRAVLTGSRKAATPYEVALSHLIHGEPLSEEAALLLDAVDAAFQSFDTDKVRDLFDACLLGRGGEEALETHFHVSPAEYAAYCHLFFDRGVFSNDFHVQAYIAAQRDDARREILKEGFTKGFDALRIKYAGAQQLTPEEALQQIFSRDVQLYVAQQDIPLGDKRVKELRALGKQVLNSATVTSKVATPKETVVASGSVEFVIQSGPMNPTLDDLMNRGVEVVR